MTEKFSTDDWLIAAALDYATVSKAHEEGRATDEQLASARAYYLDFVRRKLAPRL